MGYRYRVNPFYRGEWSVYGTDDYAFAVGGLTAGSGGEIYDLLDQKVVFRTAGTGDGFPLPAAVGGHGLGEPIAPPEYWEVPPRPSTYAPAAEGVWQADHRAESYAESIGVDKYIVTARSITPGRECALGPDGDFVWVDRCSLYADTIAALVAAGAKIYGSRRAAEADVRRYFRKVPPVG